MNSQASFTHLASQALPPQNQVHGISNMPAPYQNASYSMSFDSSQMQHAPTHQHNYTGPISNPGYSRSFGDNYAGNRGYEKAQIYTAVYSGVQVYEMEVGGVACMRRRNDGWLNATQILKVAGVDKGKRTKVLEKEILTGEHEKVQGGYGKYQGTWISYKRGRDFCRSYGVEEVLRPLLDYDVSADGSGGQGQDTPTKEQAMAANRKRFYGSALDRPGISTNGTFFQNISPTSSVALAAMGKAARLNSPGARQSQRPANSRHASQQEVPASQQSIISQHSFHEDSGYGTQPGEPPRKRLRRESTDGVPDAVIDGSISPTEPNESFVYDGLAASQEANAQGEPVAAQALPNAASSEDQEKMNLILDLFAEQGKIDYAQHPAIKRLSGEDFNLPLDASANNALHWAATLAKIPLLKLLIQKGANIWRGNVAGQSPLIAGVIVNNCWEQQCFPELLELLSPLIEVRDVQGRTVLHHIAVSSGIKGRAPSSKYYLEALLEFLVKLGKKNADSIASAHRSDDKSSAVTLVRFLSHIVNARDKAGNTALNLVARIGNRSIIQQLLEIHADPALPNNKGVSAKDFGVGTDHGELRNGGALPSTQGEDEMMANGSQVEELGQDVIESMTLLLTQNLAAHKELLRQKTEEVDLLNVRLQDHSATQKEELEKLKLVQARVKHRDERQARIRNLKRAIEERKMTYRMAVKPILGAADAEILKPEFLETVNEVDGQATSKILKTIGATFSANNAALQRRAADLHRRSSELEALYRRVVSLCTGVPEDKVEEALPSLVAAVESEKVVAANAEEHDLGRVRDFLKRVDKTSTRIEA